MLNGIKKMNSQEREAKAKKMLGEKSTGKTVAAVEKKPKKFEGILFEKS